MRRSAVPVTAGVSEALPAKYRKLVNALEITVARDERRGNSDKLQMIGPIARQRAGTSSAIFEKK